jgi:hypothetical protein
MIVALFETKTHVYAERNVRSTSPVSMAIVKLANVPIKTYSVVFISCPLLNSPKRKIDFAANRKPIASLNPTKIKAAFQISNPLSGILKTGRVHTEFSPLPGEKGQ